ncbi:hypothetical protein OHB53_09550 [Streptomyces sp. NBC_00056]|uniref:hypothetical protein n=1 Tax=Streptomyces sp. NBC_00056 TaxID=2975633 RepID=UPI0032490E61
MTSKSQPQQLNSLDIAMQWAELPAEHLKVALAALEPELARQYELSVLRARLEHQEAQDRRTHNLYLGGLIAGFIIVVAMLTGAVIVGVNDLPWLAAMLAGPSVLSLAGLFVLRRVDSASAREAGRAHREALAASQPPAQPAPVDPGAAQGGAVV